MGAWTPDVVFEDVIDPDWGNTIRDRVIHTFDSTGERDLEIVSGDRQVGMLAVTGVPGGVGAFNRPRMWMWDGAEWRLLGWWGATGATGPILTDTAQPISTGTATDITWGTEVHDPDGWTSGGSATLTVPSWSAGRYAVTFSAIWATSGLGTNPAVAVYINGAGAYGSSGTSPFGLHSVSFTRTLAAGDTLKASVYQNSGGSVNCTSRLEVDWIGH